MSTLDLLVGFVVGVLVTITAMNFYEGYIFRKALKEQKSYLELETEEEQSDDDSIVVDAEVTQETKEEQSIEPKKEDVVITEN